MYCLITGGNMYNKGAQSMTFIMINELRKRYPEDTILLMMPGDTDEKIYPVKTNTVHIKSVFYLLGGVPKAMAIAKKVDYKDIKKLSGIMKNARLMVDISGYALGSNWGQYIIRFYLCMIDLAHKYDVPIYVMPQSFGPFEFEFPYSVISNWYIKKVMRYPEVIYAREQEGYDLLIQKYKLSNVKKSCDMVLMSSSVDTKLIFDKEWKPTVIDIKKNAVAMIPNIRLLDKIAQETLFHLFLDIARILQERDKRIYILYHSAEDYEIAKGLYQSLLEKGVSAIFIDNDLNSIEYEMIISKMEFIIASRYHSLVHAYKAGTPCIAIGWAVKYQELLKEFKQEAYAFDISNIDKNAVMDAVREMCLLSDAQKVIVAQRLQKIQENNIFSCLDNVTKKEDDKR